MIWLIGLIVLWVMLNLFAPYAVLFKSQRISPGRLPVELMTLPVYHKVRFYIAELRGGYGFSVWAPPLNVVVFDKEFFARASPQLIRYVIAHELAHFNLGHHRWKWVSIVSGAVLFPIVRAWLRRMEDEADEEAARRTGLDRRLFPELGEGHNA